MGILIIRWAHSFQQYIGRCDWATPMIQRILSIWLGELPCFFFFFFFIFFSFFRHSCLVKCLVSHLPTGYRYARFSAKDRQSYVIRNAVDAATWALTSISIYKWTIVASSVPSNCHQFLVKWSTRTMSALGVALAPQVGNHLPFPWTHNYVSNLQHIRLMLSFSYEGFSPPYCFQPEPRQTFHSTQHHPTFSAPFARQPRFQHVFIHLSQAPKVPPHKLKTHVWTLWAVKAWEAQHFEGHCASHSPSKPSNLEPPQKYGLQVRDPSSSSRLLVND